MAKLVIVSLVIVAVLVAVYMLLPSQQQNTLPTFRKPCWLWIFCSSSTTIKSTSTTIITTSATSTVRTTTANSINTTIITTVPTTTVIRQYYLSISASPAGYGTVFPSNGFYAANSVVTINAIPASGHSFVSWNGFGNGSYSGINQTAAVTMFNNITEIANFR